MGVSDRDRPIFIPASSSAEAVARIYALTGAQDAGTRGEKRAIVALRDALGLDIEIARTNALMGERVAEALAIPWLPTYADKNKVSLSGLNVLLDGATEAFYAGSLRRLAGQRPAGLTGFEWAAFDPAPSKIEAVNRISALTNSGPEWLGPGSKEHKSVLINLASALAPQVDTRLSKTKLGRAVADALGAPWSAECESTGETISLIGLNVLLAGAESKLGRLGAMRSGLFGTPEEEGQALAAALLDAWRAEKQSDGSKRVHWDGKASIRWMLDQGATDGINQNEWQGFYWEARGKAVLNSAFTPNPRPPQVRFGATTFDYSLRYVWDLKAHTEWWTAAANAPRRGRAAAPLNDQGAIDQCVARQGLGFLMVGGRAIADDDGAFLAWHRLFKATQGVKSKPSNSGLSRLRKRAFEPLHVEAYWFRDTQALDAAKAAGQITGFGQGKQAPADRGGRGRIRRPKYNLVVPRARATSLAVAHYDWDPPRPHADGA